MHTVPRKSVQFSNFLLISLAFFLKNGTLWHTVPRKCVPLFKRSTYTFINGNSSLLRYTSPKTFSRDLWDKGKLLYTYFFPLTF